MIERASARLRGVDEIKLRFRGSDVAEIALGEGMHAIGRSGAGAGLALVGDPQPALVRLCVDRRGVWMTVDDVAGSVHVNGRPVRHMAMLRVGDAIYVDGVEMILVSTRPVTPLPARLGSPPADSVVDPRVVLRGVGGRYHGRSFTLERPLVVGRAEDAAVRIDDPSFPEHHARIELHGETVVLRDLGFAEGTLVNGDMVRDAVLSPGDQVVFDAHHRFVLEAPAHSAMHDSLGPALGDQIDGSVRDGHAMRQSARRLPWLLLAAVLIAGALSALLLFGVSS